ncbi:DUF302 domain-containing protein [Azonexus sp.]|uniref:DUF302 domain-containing protein n=1 Tax=Azonexus sp. TaxID=1872668 RepID=UPI0035B2C90A
MYHVVESSKSFQEILFELEPAVQRLGLSVLAVHDLGAALARRDNGFDEDYAIYDIIGWRQAEQLLSDDLRAGLFLPWRLAVYTENGATYLGFLRQPPVADPRLQRSLDEAAARLLQLLDEMR